MTAFSAVSPNYVGAYGGSRAGTGCCTNFFLPSSFSPLVPYPSFETEQRPHHRHHGHDKELVGVYEPVYIPYAVPYALDAEDDAADDQDGPDPTMAALPSRDGRYAKDAPRTRRQISAGVAGVGEPGAGDEAGVDPGYDADADAAPMAPSDPPAPVVAQPTTVLVFKDGHRSEVANYAILGDTLFDFSGARTHKILLADLDLPATAKANDAAGVEFKLPPGSEAKSAKADR
ncbi:MAG: hypothetical protein ACRD3Q_02115 [Terriglobales bacterium]